MTRALLGSGCLLLWIALSDAGFAQPRAPNLQESSETRTIRVSPGSPTSERFEAPRSTVAVSFAVHTPLPGAIVTVETPDGRVVNQQNASSLDVKFIAFDCKEDRQGMIFGCEKGSHAIVMMPSAREGTYTVHLEPSPDLNETVEAKATFSVTRPMTAAESARHNAIAEMDIDLSTSPRLEVRPLGKRFRFIVKAFYSGRPIENAVITFEIEQPDQNTPLTLTPADDGAGPDERAADGLHSVWFTPQVVGPHKATVIIGLPSQPRGTGLLKWHEFTVVSLAAELTGNVTDEAVDSNLDGGIDKVVVDVEVEVHQAAKYGLWLHLGGGSHRLFETAFVNLEPGRQSIRVELDAFELTKSRRQPPYIYDSIKLAHYTDRGAFDIDVLEGAGQSQLYDVGAFDKPLAVGGPIMDRGIDDDGDGLFDWLVVSVPVEVQHASRTYRWAAELYTSSGKLIERVRDHKQLEHKHNLVDLRFRGNRIRRAGADGPFEVRAFEFAGGDKDLSPVDLGATQNYAFGQFQTPNPRIVAVSPPYGAVGGSNLMVKINGAHTNFERLLSKASFGPGIQLAYTSYESPTQVRVSLDIAPDAELGPRTVTVVTGGERASLDNAFTVQQAPPGQSVARLPSVRVAPARAPSKATRPDGPPPAKLTGEFRDYGMDHDGNGLFDEWAVDVGVDVARAGEYELVVNIKTFPRTESNATLTAKLEPGRQRVVIPMELPHVYSLYRTNRGEKPKLPFLISSISLYSLEDPEKRRRVDVQSDVGELNPYEMARFEPPPIGAISFRGVDDDGNGLFEQLVVTVPVEVRATGKHYWSLTLANVRGETIAAVGTTAEIEAGSGEISFAFKGALIREFGADGPYLLQKFRFSSEFRGGPPGISLHELGPTPPYRANQFQPSPTLLQSVSPMGGWRGQAVRMEVRGQETSFEQGRTSIDAGQGITASVEQIVGPDLLIAKFVVGPDAAFGPRTVAVTTGDESVRLDQAFAVQPAGARPEAWLWKVKNAKHIRSLRRYPVDADQDGGLDALGFDIEVDVSEAGEYDLFLKFATHDSRFMQQHVEAKLRQGQNTLNVSVDAAALYGDSEHTPFRVSSMIFRHLTEGGRRRTVVDTLRIPDKQAEITVPRTLQ